MFSPDEYLVGIVHKKPDNVQDQSLHDYAIALNCNFWKFFKRLNSRLVIGR